MLIVKLWIIAGVSLVHLAMIAWLLNVTTAPIAPPQPSVVDISFVDPEPSIAAPPKLEPVPEPVPADDVKTAETSEDTPPLERDVRNPDPRPADAMASAGELTSPEVLVQLERDNVQLDPAIVAGGGPADTIGSDQVAAVLRGVSCRSLTRRPKPNCPQTDPFAAAEAVTAREALARNATSISFEPRFNPAEQFFAKQKEDRHMFPGMNADMFADTQAPGAYTADRIRDGREPLWDEDLKRGFNTNE